jgi:hypothetical protein
MPKLSFIFSASSPNAVWSRKVMNVAKTTANSA